MVSMLIGPHTGAHATDHDRELTPDWATETVFDAEGANAEETNPDDAIAQEGSEEVFFMALSARSSSAPAAATPSELALLQHTNADRVRHGLPQLQFDPPALATARTRANAQLNRGALSHYDSTGGLAFVNLLAQSGVQYSLAGENLARWVQSDPTGPERVQQAFMGSPDHRKNVLEPVFNRLAIGAATDTSGRIAFAQIFRAAP